MEPEFNKPSRFLSFLKVDIFKKKTALTTEPLSPLEIAKNKNNEMINTFINTENIEALNILIAEEAPFSKENIINFTSKFIDSFYEENRALYKNRQQRKHIHTRQINKFLKTNEKAIQEIILDNFKQIDLLLRSPQYMIKEFMNSTELNKKTYDDFTQFINLSMLFYGHGKNIFRDKETISHIYDLAINIEKNYLQKGMIEGELSKKDRLWLNDVRGHIITKLPQSTLGAIKSFLLPAINDMYSYSHRNDLIETAKKARNIQYNEVQNLVSQHISQNIISFDFSALPGQHVLKEIQELCVDLQSSAMNVEQKLIFDNLQQKRMPQIIQEYVTIPARYRKMLDENKDTPENLFLSSITEIKDKLSSIMTDINTESMNNLKKSNRYLRSS